MDGRRRFRAALAALGAAALLAMLSACPRKPPTPAPPALEPVSWQELGFPADDMAFDGLGRACRGSLGYYARLPGDRELRFGTRRVKVARYAEALRRFAAVVEAPGLSPREKVRRIEAGFDLYRSTGRDGRGSVLFTGYYEPRLEGRLRPGGEFRYPIFKKPPDLVSIRLAGFPLAHSRTTLYGRVEGDRVVPYYTRSEIDTGKVLSGKGLELAWFRDPVDVFFLQIQGSGVVELEGDREVRVQYDGKNGHPYVSLGRYLVDRGLMGEDEVSMARIRAFLAARPEERQAILNVNPSYTFFRLETDGPYGNIDVALTPYRSIATDAALFPKGALCFIRTEKPVLDDSGTVARWKRFGRFALNQDTGGAIKGPGRVDLFFGGGPEAATAAGTMKQEGGLYFLVPKNDG